jgi:hypothetical protein
MVLLVLVKWQGLPRTEACGNAAASPTAAVLLRPAITASGVLTLSHSTSELAGVYTAVNIPCRAHSTGQA